MAVVDKNSMAKMVLEQMKDQEVLSVQDIDKLIKMMDLIYDNYDIKDNPLKHSDLPRDVQEDNKDIVEQFCQAKLLEGKSNITIYNYRNEANKMLDKVGKHYSRITTADIRRYMSERKEESNLSSVSVQNMRQYLMSFFKWLTREEYIDINPMLKIDVIKSEQKVIDTLSDEEQEIIRCACQNERDLAIVDLLSGSAMRVSELCNLNKSDVNFNTKEIVVFGKGKKERICFMTGRAKVHLQWYLEQRVDDNEALFVTTKKPYNRITKNGVEFVLRNIAKRSKIPTKRLYPHLYRKTVATNMLKRGADPSVIQNVLGHKSVDTTLAVYCKVDKDNIKHEHDKYIN